ncbi:hypothetical protein EUTSA_v10012110mg [Eutrema salsugineum]|uniref:Uncharacterized protein n=1 Tax=Eutrema salsugineum TaxID=72664 RepID=V4KT60_EUTSA|nr:hypothetical protein EUTSA_v10012110mg [Eutrema salsugineum]
MRDTKGDSASTIYIFNLSQDSKINYCQVLL